MLTNKELVEMYLPLLTRCMEYQFAKIDKTYKEDLMHDIVVELMQYDNIKLNDAHERKHMNALLTRWIQNNVRSKTSWFYRRYKRWDALSQEISDKERNISDEG